MPAPGPGPRGADDAGAGGADGRGGDSGPDDGGPDRGGGGPGRWSARAEAAAAVVNGRYGHRLMGLPGTWIASVAHPRTGFQWPWSGWHYWWQAHYLDALVDAALRHAEQDWTGSPDGVGVHGGAGVPANSVPPGGFVAPGAPELARIRALLRGIRIRNFARLGNNYFDDMAWLALAARRASALAAQSGVARWRGARRADAVLGSRLRGGQSDRLGGGIYWSTARDYKNTPANGPAALYFARQGSVDTAGALVDWLHRELFDPDAGLYLDGVHPTATGREVERTLYTYNQGPILGALLELGSAEQLARAAELVAAVGRGFAAAEPAGAVVLHGSGDGGLFTGILLRHLAQAAIDPRLPQETRDVAAALVEGTAESLWAGRRSTPFLAFPDTTGQTAAERFGPDDAVGLSSQLQAWLAFEAADVIERGR